MASYGPRHLNELRRWDAAIPRFLFRGFNDYSGGNKRLNTHTAIIPHAFFANLLDIKNDESIGSGVDAISGPRRDFCPSSPKTLNAMPLEEFRSEINSHLTGNKHFLSHFSSWTADFGTAFHYAYHGAETYSEFGIFHPYIGILDTSRRDDANTILHVRALREEGHTTFKYDYEYLVYGPVRGISYTCMSFLPLQETPLGSPLGALLYTSMSGWPGFRTFTPVTTLQRAYNKIACENLFYQAAGAGQEARWCSCRDPALFLTVIAAEWCQDSQMLVRYGWYPMPPVPDYPQMQKRWHELVSSLSQVIEWAARDANLVLPLVNLHTDSSHSPRLALMLKLLSYFEAEIVEVRSKPPPEPWSLSRFLWGQT